MMKITKPGTKRKARKTYRGTCANCGCEFTCTESEGRVIQDREAKTGQILILPCPQCRKPIHADGPVGHDALMAAMNQPRPTGRESE